LLVKFEMKNVNCRVYVYDDRKVDEYIGNNTLLVEEFVSIYSGEKGITFITDFRKDLGSLLYSSLHNPNIQNFAVYPRMTVTESWLPTDFDNIKNSDAARNGDFDEVVSRLDDLLIRPEVLAKEKQEVTA